MRRQGVPFTAAAAVAGMVAGLFFMLAFLPAAGRGLLGGGALVQYALIGALGLGVALGARLALPTLFAAAASFMVWHVQRMALHFDFGHHMQVCVSLGGVHLLLWLLWWAKTRTRRRLSAAYVAEFFDSLEDTLGNYTTVLEYGGYSLRELLTTSDVTDAHRRQLAERLVDIVRHLHGCHVVHFPWNTLPS